MSNKSTWNFKVERTNYNGKGTLNKSKFPKNFVEIVKKTQMELKAYVVKELLRYYKDVKADDGYVIAKGDYPVVLTAHLDTVHEKPRGMVKTFYGATTPEGKNVISSPEGIGGDDRCGVFMILNILQRTDFRPTIIFCEDEEVGGIGSEKFTKAVPASELEGIKFFIELDRANGNDLVFYDDVNEEFHEFCQRATGYKESFGSFSDISNFCPRYGISGVNISCGYYNAHTPEEYVVFEEMFDSISATIKLLEAAKEIEESFEYKEYRYHSGSYYGTKWDDWFDNYYAEKKTESKKKVNELMVSAVFYYLDENFNEIEECVEAESKLGTIALFLINHPELRWQDVLDYEFL